MSLPLFGLWSFYPSVSISSFVPLCSTGPIIIGGQVSDYVTSSHAGETPLAAGLEHTDMDHSGLIAMHHNPRPPPGQGQAAEDTVDGCHHLTVDDHNNIGVHEQTSYLAKSYELDASEP